MRLVNKSYGTQLTFGKCFFFASFNASYMLGVYMFKRSKYDLLSTQQTTSERLRLHGEQIVHSSGNIFKALKVCEACRYFFSFIFFVELVGIY